MTNRHDGVGAYPRNQGHVRQSPPRSHTANSPWAPLASSGFRALWIASAASDIGAAMHGVGAGWMMTRLSHDPLVISLVQAAAMLPMFLLLLPAGALADIVDRRKLLMLGEAWSLVAALATGLVAWSGAMTPAILLALTFTLAMGAAISLPGFQAAVPELVPKQEIPAAAALGSLEVNIARAAGPALAGLVISSAGVAAVFFLNAASFVATFAMLWRWRRERRSGRLPPEHFFAAMRVGWRYAVRNPAFLTVLLRAGVFFSFASALWALLPLVGKQKLGGSPYGYSILLSCLGAGAVLSATVLPKIRATLGSNALVIAASLLFAAASAVAALAHDFVVVCIAMLAAGGAWFACVTTFNVAARFAFADWVMARGLAMNQMLFYGMSALGAVLWGQFAKQASVDAALLASAVGLAIASISGLRYRLATEPENLEPAPHWAVPRLDVTEPRPSGAVLVTVEYRVRKGDTDAFLAAMHDIEPRRLRNGAVAWHLYRDLEDGQRFVEHFLESSWVDHLRHHERTTVTDRTAEEAVGRTLERPAAYKVTHLAIAR